MFKEKTPKIQKFGDEMTSENKYCRKMTQLSPLTTKE